jgi:superfamily I DNA/RNA helicase
MKTSASAPALTSEQEAIVAAARAGGSFRVLALAGTGKTSTLVAIARTVPASGLYLAFNRAIADEARRRFPEHVSVKTAHGLAYAAYGHHFQAQGRLENSSWALRQAILDRYERALSAIGGPRRTSTSSFAVLATLNAFMASASERVDIQHVPIEYHELDSLAVVELAQVVFDAMTNLEDSFPSNHDAYLKAWALTAPRLSCQVIYFDEAQDANPVLLHLVQQQQHLQRIFVGDSNQAIYSFRHAINAMQSLDLPTYPLTQSWRFGPKVAKVANSILWAKDEQLRVRGRPDRADSVIAKNGALPDVVLARTNAGLFEEAVAILPRLGPDDRIAFVGGIEEVTNMVLAAYELFSNGRTRHPGFRFFKKWDELQGIVENGQGGEFGPFVKLVERHGKAIPAMSEAVRAAAVSDERQARVVFSTAHRYKGKEAPIVRLASDFPLFCAFNKKRRRYEFLFEEANLAYVAVTRAEQVLDLEQYLPILLGSIENRKKLHGSARDHAA